MHRFRHPWLLLSSLLLMALPLSAQAVRRPLVIRGATLIDGTGAPPQPNVTIVVERGEIAAVGPKVEEPADAELIDATGKFIIPGLIDARVQLGASPGNRVLRAEHGLEQRIENLHALLAAGVTSVRLVQGDLEEQKLYQQFAQNDLLASPRLFVAGPTFTAPDGRPAGDYSILATRVRDRETRQAKDADEAREKAREVAHSDLEVFEAVYDAGPTGNTYPRLSQEALKTLVEEAHGHELKIFCAVGWNEEATTAVAAGADVIEDAAEELLTPELLAEMARKNIFFLPSLSLQGDLLKLLDAPALQSYLQEPLVQQSLSAVMKKSLAGEGGLLAQLRKGLSDQEAVRTLLKLQQERAFENVRRARTAGVALAVGTGAGNTLIFPGPAVHRELQLLVEAGLSPLEALVAATRRTAESLGKGEELGTIEPGKRADLVILDADPLVDIKNTQKIHRVIRSGQVIDPGELGIY